MKKITKKLTLLPILVLMIFSAFQCFPVKAGANEIYIWKDEQGRTHATDSPPPDNAQIIESFQPSVSTPPPETKTNKQDKKDKTGYWEAVRRANDAEKKAKAAQARVKTLEEKAAAALRTAKEATQKAEEYMKRGGSKKKRRWNRREAEKYEDQAKQAKARAAELEEQKTAAIREQKIAEAAARRAEAEASRLSP